MVLKEIHKKTYQSLPELRAHTAIETNTFIIQGSDSITTGSHAATQPIATQPIATLQMIIQHQSGR
jgi:hypothetical protein